jgi:uncharacterized protein YbjT (DUF2867 family)
MRRPPPELTSDDLPEAYLRFLYGSRIDHRTIIHSRPDAIREAEQRRRSYRANARPTVSPTNQSDPRSTDHRAAEAEHVRERRHAPPRGAGRNGPHIRRGRGAEW